MRQESGHETKKKMLAENTWKLVVTMAQGEYKSLHEQSRP